MFRSNKDDAKKKPSSSAKKVSLVADCRMINFPSTMSYLIAFAQEWSKRCKAVYGACGHVFDDDAYIIRPAPEKELVTNMSHMMQI
jgi:hypothetical protein